MDKHWWRLQMNGRAGNGETLGGDSPRAAAAGFERGPLAGRE